MKHERIPRLPYLRDEDTVVIHRMRSERRSVLLRGGQKLLQLDGDMRMPDQVTIQMHGQIHPRLGRRGFPPRRRFGRPIGGFYATLSKSKERLTHLWILAQRPRSCGSTADLAQAKSAEVRARSSRASVAAAEVRFGAVLDVARST